jgi:hypothetical protein
MDILKVSFKQVFKKRLKQFPVGNLKIYRKEFPFCLFDIGGIIHDALKVSAKRVR